MKVEVKLHDNTVTVYENIKAVEYKTMDGRMYLILDTGNVFTSKALMFKAIKSFFISPI